MLPGSRDWSSLGAKIVVFLPFWSRSVSEAALLRLKERPNDSGVFSGARLTNVESRPGGGKVG